MTLGHISMAFVAAVPQAHATKVMEQSYFDPAGERGVAAPFRQVPNCVLYPKDLVREYIRERHFVSSSAGSNHVVVTVERDDSSPSELVQEFRRLSGLTLEQIAGAFDVSRRTVHSWISGSPVSGKNHEKLGAAVAAIRFIDRGAADENRNLLMEQAESGQTYLELFRAGDFDQVREAAGKGKGRIASSGRLSAEAERYNAPDNFAASLGTSLDADETEILPVKKSTSRKLTLRRNKQ